MAKTISMATVNGPLSVEEAISVHVPNLERTVEFIIVKDSPPLLSVGRLCMLEGYGFFWPPRQIPWLISPTGRRINLQVHDFVPYCSANKPAAEPKVSKQVAAGIRALMKQGRAPGEDDLVPDAPTAVPAGISSPDGGVVQQVEPSVSVLEPSAPRGEGLSLSLIHI